MTGNWIGIAALAPLIILLLMASLEDVRSHRIPNVLVLSGILIGVVLNALLPAGLGFNSTVPGGIGWWAALEGLGFGVAVFLPVYLLRAMGAGDVKLMGMVGAFLGWGDVLGVVIATFIAGGVMALMVVLWSRQLKGLLANIRLMLLGGLLKMNAGGLPVVDEVAVSVGKLPYAVAITTGTLGHLLWQRM